MLARVNQSAQKEHIGNRIIKFTGLTGDYHSDGTFRFDEESIKKLPKCWISHGEKEGYDPYSYVFDFSEVDIL